MSSSQQRILPWNLAVFAALILAVGTSLIQGCSICDSPSSWSAQVDTEDGSVPLKRDIFISRGWGAGGGPAFTGRMSPHLSKRPRIIEMLVNDEGPEEVPEPRTEYLRAPPSYLAKPRASQRHAYLPQLFISSGWGPLGK